MKHLTEFVADHKQDTGCGIFAVCSAHPLVLEAALRHARDTQSILLIEATSNQVDQYGGYTGMTPADFHRFVEQMADSHHFPPRPISFRGRSPRAKSLAKHACYRSHVTSGRAYPPLCGRWI